MATLARALLFCGLAGRLAAASRTKGAGAGGRQFLKGGQDLQPEMVADLLTKVEEEWKAQAADFVACNDTLNSSCGMSAEAFKRSCSTVVSAVVKGSSGDRRVVADYMGTVCDQPSLQGWKRKNCQGLQQSLAAFMTADDYANRQQMDAAGLCRSLWQSFSKEELEEHQAELARQEKEREEAEKRAAEEAKRQAEEEAKRKEEEAKRAAEEAKQKAEEEAEEAQHKAEEEKRQAEEKKRRDKEEAVRQAAEAKRQAEEAASRVRAKQEEAAKEAELAKEKMREAQAAAQKIREHQSPPTNATASAAAEVAAASPTNASVLAVPTNTSSSNVSNASVERLTTVVGVVRSSNATVQVNATTK